MLRSESLEVEQIRKDFPILKRKIHGKRLAYLDNAATTQKPRSVIRSIVDFYGKHNANPHRGVHQLSIEATEAFDDGRKKVASFINSPAFEEVVFTRGATEAINLVRYAWGPGHVKRGDLIVLTIMEHHSNIVPWQLLAKEVGARIEYVGITPEGHLRRDEFERLLEQAPALVAFTHCSNVLGTINDAAALCASARRAGATTVVDAAQSVPHMPVDVQKMGCDFLAFSVVGDTPVLIECAGEVKLVPIEEAVELYDRGSEVRILTLGSDAKASFERVKGTLTHLDRVYEIDYEGSAFPVLATAHHSVYVWRDGNMTEDKVSNLREGDYLVTLNKQDKAGFEGVRKFSLEYKHDHNLIREEVEITKELMRLVGYYLAEGSIDPTNNRVSLTFAESEAEYVKDACALIGGLNPIQYYAQAFARVKTMQGSSLMQIATTTGISRKTAKKYSTREEPAGLARTESPSTHVWYNPRNHTANIAFNSKKWFEFFKSFCGSRDNKHLPSFTWKVDTEFLAELLKGYLRGDASKNENYRLVVKSVSRRMISELSWVLKLHGISNTLGFAKSHVERWNDMYTLVIQRSELADIKEFHKSTSKKDSPRDKSLCVDGLRDAYRRTKPKYDSKISSALRSSGKRASREAVLNIVRWIESTHKEPIDSGTREILNRYKLFAKGDFGLVKIRAMRSAEERLVYDVSVETSERFFGGLYPVLLHNSGHKMLGPTGIGVLYGRRALLEDMEPFESGGDMIKEVHTSGARWNDLPYKFEAGTQNVEGVVGLAAAIDYLNHLGMERVRSHERELTAYALEQMAGAPGITVYGPKDSAQRGGVVSFNLGDIHPHDLASILDEEGVAIRSGQHCAQPLLESLGIMAATRASFYVYNSQDDVDALMLALSKARRIFCL